MTEIEKNLLEKVNELYASYKSDMSASDIETFNISLKKILHAYGFTLEEYHSLFLESNTSIYL